MKRNISFDLLRILSAFAIVVLHTSSTYMERLPIGSSGFRIANFYDSLSRFGIPVFVMISGAIFLSEEKKITVKKLWLGNILRLLIIFGVWSFAYYFYQCKYYWNISVFHKGITGVVTGCVYASNHFWFIFMIVGLYALVPLLRSFLSAAGKKELHYFMALFFLFQILRNTVTILADSSLVSELSDRFTITEFSGYLGYFVLGYLLTKWDMPQKGRTVLYAFLPVCLAGNYLSSAFFSQKMGSYHPGIYDSFGVLTFFLSCTIFIFCKNLGKKISPDGRRARFLYRLSLDTLGIYLLHVGILDYMESKNLLFGTFDAAVGVPLISVTVFVFCAAVSALLRRLPVIGRYLA